MKDYYKLIKIRLVEEDPKVINPLRRLRSQSIFRQKINHKPQQKVDQTLNLSLSPELEGQYSKAKSSHQRLPLSGRHFSLDLFKFSNKNASIDFSSPNNSNTHKKCKLNLEHRKLDQLRRSIQRVKGGDDKEYINCCYFDKLNKSGQKEDNLRRDVVSQPDCYTKVGYNSRLLKSTLEEKNEDLIQSNRKYIQLQEKYASLLEKNLAHSQNNHDRLGKSLKHPEKHYTESNSERSKSERLDKLLQLKKKLNNIGPSKSQEPKQNMSSTGNGFRTLKNLIKGCKSYRQSNR